MSGSDQIALVFQGRAIHPRRSILRALRRFERMEAEGWLYRHWNGARADVQALLVANGGNKQKALQAWRLRQYEEWAAVFDYAETIGLFITKSQRALRLAVNERVAEGRRT
jgi:hypothetical protein